MGHYTIQIHEIFVPDYSNSNQVIHAQPWPRARPQPDDAQFCLRRVDSDTQVDTCHSRSLELAGNALAALGFVFPRPARSVSPAAALYTCHVTGRPTTRLPPHRPPPTVGARAAPPVARSLGTPRRDLHRTSASPPLDRTRSRRAATWRRGLRS